ALASEEPHELERSTRAESVLKASAKPRMLRRPAYVVRLVQRLRDREPALLPALRVIEESLAAAGQTIDDAVNVELQRQAALQTTIANVIGSMRLLSQAEWADFFEEVSGVEALLSRDPAGVHA